MGDIVTVCLMRHAPTKANLEKRYLGWTDAPLADTSKLSVVDASIETVYGSDLQRCRTTAAHYFPNASYYADARLRESNFGEFEGKTYEDLKRMLVTVHGWMILFTSHRHRERLLMIL